MAKSSAKARAGRKGGKSRPSQKSARKASPQPGRLAGKKK